MTGFWAATRTKAGSPSASRQIQRSLLWINGPAGYGKTFLTARIIQHLTNETTAPVASFFFFANLEDRADPFIIARSWVS